MLPSFFFSRYAALLVEFSGAYTHSGKCADNLQGRRTARWYVFVCVCACVIQGGAQGPV